MARTNGIGFDGFVYEIIGNNWGQSKINCKKKGARLDLIFNLGFLYKL